MNEAIYFIGYALKELSLNNAQNKERACLFIFKGNNVEYDASFFTIF